MLGLITISADLIVSLNAVTISIRPLVTDVHSTGLDGETFLFVSSDGFDIQRYKISIRRVKAGHIYASFL